MKKYKILVWVLIAALTVTMLLTGCGGKKDDHSASADSNNANLNGTYLLDSTALGMPLQVYLIIKNGDTFQWTNRREGGDDKGKGTIGKNGDTYLLLYSDSTAETPKTATFKVVRGNLLFSTRVPYGTSGFSPNTEDENNIIYPVANKLAFEEYLGEYVGKSAEYNYTLELSYGAQYTVTSIGKSQTYTETGLFDIKDSKLILTPEGGSAKQASWSEDKSVNLPSAQLNQSGKKADIQLRKAITAAYAGTYTAPGGIQLELDKLGAYHYKVGNYSESGTFKAIDAAVTFTAADGAKRTGTVETYIAKASFPKSSGGAVSEFTAYESIIQGNFTASEEVKEGTDAPAGKYEATLTLDSNGKYTFHIVKNGKSSYSEKGTFSTSLGPVGPSLDLTSENRDNSTGVIAKNGALNLRILVDTELNETGFKFEKKQ